MEAAFPGRSRADRVQRSPLDSDLAPNVPSTGSDDRALKPTNAYLTRYSLSPDTTASSSSSSIEPWPSTLPIRRSHHRSSPCVHREIKIQPWSWSHNPSISPLSHHYRRRRCPRQSTSADHWAIPVNTKRRFHSHQVVRQTFGNGYMPCGVTYRIETVGRRAAGVRTQYSGIYQRRCEQNERVSACKCSSEKAKERAAGTFGDDSVTLPRSIVPATFIVTGI